MLARPTHSRRYPWYDSIWLERYADAHDTVRRVRPELLDEFTDAFRVLHTRDDFETQQFERVFDDETIEAIKTVAASLAPSDLELHEARIFKRFVVHDHQFFSALQEQLTPLVSEAAGEPVEPGYNFLSLYGPGGVCPPHLDSPQAKWTLDFCIDQSGPWPIFLSQAQAWPAPL